MIEIAEFAPKVDCSREEIDCKREEMDCSREEIDCKREEIDCSREEIDCKREEIDCKREEIDCSREETMRMMGKCFIDQPEKLAYGVVLACRSDRSLLSIGAEMLKVSKDQLQALVRNYNKGKANSANLLAEKYQNERKQKLVRVLPDNLQHTLRQIAEGLQRYPANFSYENSLQEDLHFLERCGLVKSEEVVPDVRSYTLWLT
ncbi:MAG: hypothetical protein GX205_09215 [Firmicutes bacterium]|nr:hypothetical protein [Bacillota bacterium]